jgi:ATP/maltotriose-dependent transcriptional regulator MalT
MHLVAELREQIEQMQKLGRYSVDSTTRRSLAAVIADACALAGWQWLDRGNSARAWDYYAQGITAAAESESPALRAYLTAGQSVVLLDAGDAATAVAMTEHACAATNKAPRILAAWLSAAHGEACAANKRHMESLRAFDAAEEFLDDAIPEEAAFLVFGRVHLTRWRGNALARLGDRSAADVLSRALDALPQDFTRAETALLTDLAEAHHYSADQDAANHFAARAELLARQIGSERHQRRISHLRRTVSPSPAGSSAIHP